jgi:hypothetical protein
LTIAHDKGKPVARQGRKAVSLSAALISLDREATKDSLVAEGDRRKPALKILVLFGQ